MNKQQRIMLAARLRQFSELERAGVSASVALKVAAADNPEFGMAAPKSVADLLPPSLPLTKALVWSDDGGVDSGLLNAVADVLDEPGTRATGWSVLLSTLVVAGLVVTLFGLYVAPAFQEMFDAFGAKLPAPTVLAIFVSQWVIAPLGTLVLLLLLARAIWSWRPELLGSWTPKIDAALLRFPMLGQASRVLHTRRLASWLAATGTGGKLAARLECLAELAGPSQFSRQVKRLAKSVQGGKVLADAMAAPGWLPGLAMVLRDATNAESDVDGETRKALLAYASGLDARSDTAMARLTLAAQIIFSMVIGFFVVAMYLPIFKMGSAI